MKTYLILTLFLCSGALASATEKLHYIDYKGHKHGIELSINNNRGTIVLEDYHKIKLHLSLTQISGKGPAPVFESEEAPPQTHSKSEPAPSLYSVAVFLGKEAAQACRQDIQNRLDSGFIVSNTRIEELCPDSATGSLLIAIRNFGFLNYCLIP